MSRSRSPPTALLSMLACCSLVACSASPPTRYYTLQSDAPRDGFRGGSASGMVPANQAVVRLEPVVIPPELDRLELVSRSGPYRVRITDSDRWAAPLDEQIRRVLSDDLAARLPPHLVADPNEPASNDPRRLLSIAIAEFYADGACATTLRADWTLRGTNGDSERGTEQVQRPGATPCTDAIAAAMSSALGMLADRLASVILAQPVTEEAADAR